MATSEVEALSPSPIKEFLLTYLMPNACYDTFFVDLNFLHGPCLKIVLSKTLGLWILFGTVLAQIPQVWKLLRAGSAEGLSLPSVLVELYALSVPVVYCIANNFPIGAWGDRVFALILTLATGFLVLHYRDNTAKGVLLLLAHCGGMLLAFHVTPLSVLSRMQASGIAAVVLSKGLQAGTNYCNGHTGQLSGLSVSLVFAGSLALIFTSLQETGQSLNTLGHVVSACLSCLLLAQVLWYWNRSTSVKEKKQ